MKKLHLVCLVLVWAVGLNGCLPQPRLSALKVAAAQSCVIKVGVLTNLQSSYGKEELQGYEMAQTELNQAGGLDGCSLELLVRDDMSLADQTMIYTRELIEEEQVSVILGSYSSATTLAAARLANQRQVPLISPVAIGDVIPKMGYEYVFSMPVDSSQLVGIALDWLDGVEPSENKPRLALVFETTLTGYTVAGAMMGQAARRGYRLVSYDPFYSGGDFSPVLANLSDSRSEIIFLYVREPKDLQLFLDKMQGWHIRPSAIIGIGGAFTSSEYLTGKISNTDNTLVASEWYAGNPGQDKTGIRAEDFAQTYARRYGNPPGLHALQTYAGMKLAGAALAEALKSGRQNLAYNTARALRDNVDFDGRGKNTANQPLLSQMIEGEMVPVFPEELKQRDAVFPLP